MCLFIKSLPHLAFGLLLALLTNGCHPSSSSNGQQVLVSQAASTAFAEYWFQGKAELNTYEIRQQRYGEERTGETVMIFVTEDLSAEKQVKLDNPSEAGADRVPVMKLNHIRSFITGIYDYSMMQSVFTPIDLKSHPHTLKTTTTSQDWCGHSFLQFNLKGNRYLVQSFSYFESEGDETFKLNADLLEDEIWTRLRIAPESIPEGQVNIVPASFYARLNHQRPEPKQARIRFEDNGEVTYLILEYLHLDRTLSIGFEPIFPYKILSWNEQMEGRTVSAGKLKATMMSAYWRQHDNVHQPLRDTLQLR